MKVGTKSLLWGAHAVWWHPLMVGLAWRWVHDRWPSWREWVCIFLHDIGYWGCPNMDGREGCGHPLAGANLLSKIFRDTIWFWLSYLHSGKSAKAIDMPPSRLYLPDKACILFEPRWFYLLRVRLTGEWKEYINFGPPETRKSLKAWFEWCRITARLQVLEYKVKKLKMVVEGYSFKFASWPINGPDYASIWSAENSNGLATGVKRLQELAGRNPHWVGTTKLYGHKRFGVVWDYFI